MRQLDPECLAALLAFNRGKRLNSFMRDPTVARCIGFLEVEGLIYQWRPKVYRLTDKGASLARSIEMAHRKVYQTWSA